MKKLKRITILFFALALVLTAAFALAACPAKQENVIDKYKHSLVEITCGNQIGSGVIFNLEDVNVDSATSGYKKAYIVTNYHIIFSVVNSHDSVAITSADFAAIKVRFFGESQSESCTVLGYSREYDIAVLSIDVGAPDTSVAIDAWGDAEVGERVYSLAYNGTFSAFDGMVSNSARFVKVADRNVNLYLTETTAPSPLGSSGGPCISENGKLIGLNAYNTTVGGVMQGLSHKIPASILRAATDMIIAGENKPFALALPFVIHSDGTVVVTCYDGIFEVQPLADGLRVTSSNYEPLPKDSLIRTANGNSAGIRIFLSELIKTGKDTDLK